MKKKLIVIILGIFLISLASYSTFLCNSCRTGDTTTPELEYCAYCKSENHPTATCPVSNIGHNAMSYCEHCGVDFVRQVNCSSCNQLTYNKDGGLCYSCSPAEQRHSNLPNAAELHLCSYV